MVFVPIARTNHKWDLEQIRRDVAKIRAEMPRKTTYQEQIEALEESCQKYALQVNALMRKAETLMSMNEELVRYIENIEEVKQSGGVNIRVETCHNPIRPTCAQMKIVTIPEVKIAVIVED